MEPEDIAPEVSRLPEVIAGAASVVAGGEVTVVEVVVDVVALSSAAWAPKAARASSEAVAIKDFFMSKAPKKNDDRRSLTGYG
jgi:hypothetical protein